MKKIFVFFGIISVIMSFFTIVHARDMVVVKQTDNEIYAVAGGTYIAFEDASPFIDENGRTQIPVRALSEALGYNVSWDADTQTVSIFEREMIIKLTIGKNDATVNGTTFASDTAPRIVDNYTYVPLRIIGEMLGYNVDFYDHTGNTLFMATNAQFPPYEYYDDYSKTAGIDIELGQAIVERLGKTLQIKDIEFDAALSRVQLGIFDFGIAGVTQTIDRIQYLDFSEPYAKNVQYVIVTDNSPIKSVDDLYADDAHCTIGVKASTTGAIYANDDFWFNCYVEQFNTGSDAIAALIDGSVDCVIIDEEPAKQYASENPALKILDTPYVDEEYRVFMPKGSLLTDDINEVIAQMKADGTLNRIISKYIHAD